MTPVQKLAFIHNQVPNWIDYREDWLDKAGTLTPLVGYNAMCHLSEGDDYMDFPIIPDGEVLKSIGKDGCVILIIGSDCGNIVVYEQEVTAGRLCVRCHGPKWFTRLTNYTARELDARDLDDIFGDVTEWVIEPNIVKRFTVAVELYCLE